MIRVFAVAALLAVGIPALAGTAVSDMPDQSQFGLCTAYENNENGRDNGNAGQAPPFQDLEENAEENDQTVEEYCDDIPHPSENADDEADDGDGEASEADGNGPPDDRGDGR